MEWVLLMKYFYDTEFLEDGNTIDLISIGILAEDGRTYYAVNSDADWGRVVRHDWLRNNVWQHLPLKRVPSNASVGIIESVDRDNSDVKRKSLIASEVMSFLRPNPSDYRDCELWAWCGAYDHVALMQLWGTMSSVHGTGLPFYTNDLKSLHDLFLTDDQRAVLREIPVPGDAAHNALADALQLQQRFDYVAGFVEI